MNRDCHGDYFPSLKKYRCVIDGSFQDVEALPVICPNCERNVASGRVIENPRTRTVTVSISEVELPSGLWVEMERKAS